jgi:AcrR family transcriptional regulator
MRQESTDRRSQRTRQQLTQALAELMHTKRYNAISVREITERANIGRSTFYAHFTDKDDLLVQGVRHMVDDLEQDVPGARNTLTPSLGLFQHVATAQDLYLTMAHGRQLNLFLDALQSELTALFVDRLAPRLPDTPTRVPPPLLAAMTAGMLITTVRSWLESDMSSSAQEVNRSFVIAAEAALRAGLRPALET